MKKGFVSLQPGSMQGMKGNKTPKLVGGKRAPASITNALGIHPTTKVSPMMLGKLVGHPDPKVRSAVKKMLGGY